MAMTALAPSIVRSRKAASGRTAKAALSLVPDLSSGKRVDHKGFAIFVTFIGVCGLLALLTINTLLAQDAFELRRLTSEVTSLSDQREAVMREIAKVSSPEVLAMRAHYLGMVASQNPRFISLKPDAVQPVGNKG
ncbi:MAG: hypothetical protein F2704_05485 [Actinobacteria bacterium]|uniref:Unannotated protein n=1 Tax=freshwater metagenome TaxID=449393 RepID=A0A6J7CS62_9ZZZZ|nr:hypothetical protein [Actinomycetota bacterium]MSX24611.1 hypothetical protein [Actinomycetota bacterium]MSY46402.1 hypothetical protein [Actinomycetota bacterium]MSY57696.1 hypothetical protein [Actinomycetota bacterium]MTA99950.1 hypothetical protein [Actinomycetota bacterium]